MFPRSSGWGPLERAREDPPAEKAVTQSNSEHEVREAICAQAKLFDTVQQAVIATTLQGSIVYWNRAALRIYGWREDEVLGRDILEVTPSRISRETAMTIMEHLRAGRSWSGEFPVKRKDGVEFTAHVRDVPVRDGRGELVGIVGISTPVAPL